MNKYVSRGRAAPIGRTTRKSRAVRRTNRGQSRPLPFDLQVLPQRCAPIKVHPGCLTEGSQFHAQAQLQQDWRALLSGVGLSDVGRYRIHITSVLFGDRTFFSDDALYALAYMRALRHWDLTADMFDTVR